MTQFLLKPVALALLVLATTTGVSAQTASTPKSLKAFATLHSNPTKAATNKVTAMNSREIGSSFSEWNSGAWLVTDSSAQTFTGTRGGSGESDLGWEFEERQDFSLNAGTLEYNELTVRTYDANNRPLTETYKIWNGTAWENDSRVTVTYTASSKFASFTIESWTGTAWQFYNRSSYTFDANDNELVGLDEVYTGGAWVNEYRYTNTYDANNNLLTETNEEYNGAWAFTNRYVYTYDANGNTLTETSEEWMTGAWVPQSKATSTFNASNLPLTTLVQTYNGGVWDNQQLETNTYDVANYTVTIVSQQFTGGQWENSYKMVQVRNAGFTSQTVTYYYWNGSVWEEGQQTVTTYNADNLVTLEIAYAWDMGAWVANSKQTYTYNSFKQITSLVNEFNTGSGLENQNRELYYYETYEDGTIGITTIPTLSSSVLPNPFTVNVAIQLTVTEGGNHTFEVYNMAGQRIYTETNQLAPGRQTIVWDGQEAPTGVYFYKVLSQNGVASGKLIKQ